MFSSQISTKEALSCSSHICFQMRKVSFAVSANVACLISWTNCWLRFQPTKMGRFTGTQIPVTLVKVVCLCDLPLNTYLSPSWNFRKDITSAFWMTREGLQQKFDIWQAGDENRVFICSTLRKIISHYVLQQNKTVQFPRLTHISIPPLLIDFLSHKIFKSSSPLLAAPF